MARLQSALLLVAANIVLSVTALDEPFDQISEGKNYVPKKSLLACEKVHGFLMWASMGFLMPVAMLLIRMSKAARKQGSSRRLELLFYLHVVLQTLAVILATVGAVLSMFKFKNKFLYTHQRLGLALYIIVWIQPIVGLLRPERGMQGRSLWYFVHWLLGTGGVILGIVNTYSGFHSYEFLNSTSLRTVNILFSMEVSFIAVFYLIQDRWGYLIQQGALKSKTVAPAIVDSQQQQPQQDQVPDSQGHVTSVECSGIFFKV